MISNTSSRRALTLSAASLSLLAAAACGTASTTKTHTGAMPTDSAMPSDSGMPTPSETGMGGMGGMGGSEHHADPGKGLLSTENGYTLKPASTALKVGTQTIRFTITGPDGKPQTSYTLDQTKLLHFYLIRADLTGYVHDHPTLGSDGVWSITVTTAKPGPYRMYTDFVAKDASGTDHPVVLSAALTAPGAYAAAPVTPPMAGMGSGSGQSQAVDGLTVTMSGQITSGTASKVTFQVSKAGKPVTDLEQYLDSFAHMTALHAGDLAYQHVHPELTAAPGQKGGPALPFSVDLPEKGTWRLFLQVQRAGMLHLLPLTVTVS